MDSAELIRQMRLVAESLSEPGDVGDSIARITRAACETVPGADYASLSVRHADGSLETQAPTDELVRQLDHDQYELREGPCYESVTDEPVNCSPDIGNDERWRRFGPRAEARGIRSQLAVRISDKANRVTALNMYSSRLDAFDPSDGLAMVFASHASIALGYAAMVDSLSEALGSRAQIGKAIGILMRRYGLSDDRAFEFLVRLSNTSNVKLREVAAQVVEHANSDAEATK